MLVTDAQMRNLEAAQGMLGREGIGGNGDGGETFSAAKQQSDAEIKALLGPERFAQYEDYQKTMGERMQLDQFKNQLAADNMAMRDEQKAQLFQIMKEEKASVPPIIPTDQTQPPRKDLFTPENIDKQSQWMTDYNQRVLARATQVLTPEQARQFQSFQEQQLSMQKLGLNMARQMLGGGKGAAGTPGK